MVFNVAFLRKCFSVYDKSFFDEDGQHFDERIFQKLVESKEFKLYSILIF